MAVSSYADPTWLPQFRELVRVTGDGGFAVEPVGWA